ncbi:WXG100 family type VII secretion target [Streptomyces monticola]|uniref:WXG100 family type VII secretion target n=1 Tax=Streptomyces monticola TaxID=2666263 RepID=A0ABW2JIJ3_9ACTN
MSSTGGSSLGYSDIAKAKTAIEDTMNSMNQQVRALSEAINMVAGSWHGQGASQFVKAQNDLNNDHKDIHRRLQILHEAVDQTRNLNESNDVEVQAAFKGVDTGGGAAAASAAGGSGIDRL